MYSNWWLVRVITHQCTCVDIIKFAIIIIRISVIDAFKNLHRDQLCVSHHSGNIITM